MAKQPKPQSQELTLTHLKKSDKQLNKRKKELLSNGTHIFVDQYFRDTKIQNVIFEYQKIHEQHQNEIEDIDAFKSIGISNLLLLKEFTSLGKYIPDDVLGMLEFLDLLIDQQLLEELMNLLPADQKQRMADALTKYADTVPQFTDKLVQTFLQAELKRMDPDA